ncbi:MULTISPECIES: DUF4183 domain-containing protein [Paenibacillus]|jgi:hypothetical protein|uniref:DUF4183 domain-containing protein n=2 Tax=Paenibacillus barengoltzii TaxID=343517 RepID=R9LER1_9BACL|nr:MULTISPECIES: DUF4183 domain-containing protein [Paenibacillus]EOS56831.1 hypothetical protein C812_01760 [Paenibacillus barengoltzii G22]MDU0329531.1 DUF4183 domain-containing protein [Paenibacillus sp. 3LSP]MEC2344799.1 DUF4183 domain-containing protein [Paenibacillus barengoltzii]SMF01274.1 protein of unknown function [Paenibacillus barengoltzii]SMF27783.1 protein of unknown function [Paenibacillus barengoltzii J12]
MPVIKPVFTAVASAPVASGGEVTTVITPTVSRYFATLTADMIGATETTIPADSFVDDADAPITDLPELTTTDYLNVYINGVLQQASLSTLTTASLVLDTVDLTPGIPVMIEVGSFSNVVSTITTPPTISAPTITIIT